MHKLNGDDLFKFINTLKWDVYVLVFFIISKIYVEPKILKESDGSMYQNCHTCQSNSLQSPQYFARRYVRCWVSRSKSESKKTARCDALTSIARQHAAVQLLMGWIHSYFKYYIGTYYHYHNVGCLLLLYHFYVFIHVLQHLPHITVMHYVALRRILSALFASKSLGNKLIDSVGCLL